MPRVIQDPVALVDPKTNLESRLCRAIINKETGAEFPRNLDPRARWFQLYNEAKLNPDRFDVEMEEAPKTVLEVEGEKRSIFGQKELEAMSMPKLREIGNMYDVADTRKLSLINKILLKQEAIVARVSVDDLK